MPKHNVRTDVAHAPSAASLIAQVEARGPTSTIPAPSAAALAELRAVIEHNDASPRSVRVPADRAIELLRALGWGGKSRVAFEAVCKRHFGRRSYGTP